MIPEKPGDSPSKYERYEKLQNITPSTIGISLNLDTLKTKAANNPVIIPINGAATVTSTNCNTA
eukprot:CAMPEP_0206185996 /NCGR_PEP_ID=MMETSP0166-20121206/2149_1 /ASSEMBLY_ACC=CAM_ASM_000260 /TAXON_ID=95228 /ORGANISM="Vannella robusta, Strain DIVA3 518/3/11/1/6" /LENGTH=63 /DNA_ID=CAMNT_0053601315 /DNA_START=693 /DNA_END=880 /DNA_ORIENTATION=-